MPRIAARPALVAALLLAHAAAAPAVAAAPGGETPDDPPVDLALRDAPTLDVLRAFARIRGLALVAEPGIEGTSTAELTQVPWSLALAHVCRSSGLRCRADAPRGMLFADFEAPPERPDDERAAAIDLALRDADLHDILVAFGRVAGVEVVIAADVARVPLTVNLDQVPWPLAMEVVCGLADCRVRWEADRVRIESSDPAPRAGPRFDLDLEDEPLRRLVERLADLPIFGRPLRVSLDPDLDAATVSASLAGATWADVLDTACRALGCAWTLVYDPAGDPILQIELLDEALEAPFELAPWRGRLDLARGILTERLGLRIRLDPALDGASEVHLASAGAPGHQLLDDLAAQLDALWRLDGDAIVVTPRRVLFDHSPTSGPLPPPLAVRWGSARNETSALLSLTPMAPAGSVRAGDLELRFVWLPFGDAGSYLLILGGDCAARPPRTTHRMLVPLPFELPLRLGPPAVPGTLLLRRVAAASDGALPRAGAAGCAAPAGHVVVELADGGASARIPAAAGTHLSVTAPVTDANPDPDPAAALVVLDVDPGGRLGYLLVRPDDLGRSPERRTLAAGEVVEIEMVAGGGPTLRMRYEPDRPAGDGLR